VIGSRIKVGFSAAPCSALDPLARGYSDVYFPDAQRYSPSRLSTCHFVF
jgi:hypothetical protein